MGINSSKSKLAFSSKRNALIFQERYNGKIVDFKQSLLLATNSLDHDHKILNKIYQKKVFLMGKKIFEKNCKKDIDFEDYLEINELKFDLKTKFCKKLTKQRLHYTTLYLWYLKNGAVSHQHNSSIVLTKKEKCPVCGMFTYKYPRWAAQIFYKSKQKETHYSFDGVKDMMKFYFNPQAWGNYKDAKIINISKMLVTDYYEQTVIDARKAFYVIRSDIYGPMGHELIPFANYSDALNFKKDHFGTKILKFDEIKEEEVYELD
ncbi:MAG TPA: hypothetical protein EYG97_01440 [Arcobacter sp.]|nr:hypothetical protein [Arcobacter sp.]HIP55669.1 hypothetical protein [Arcobacter sp.]